MIITHDIIGIPSGQIINITHKELNELLIDKILNWDYKLILYTFDDDDYSNIMTKLYNIF
jgi:hypothetical protein